MLNDISTHHGFKVAHLNCRSLVLHIDELRTIFSVCHDIHILSINETRLDPGICDDEVSLPGFRILRCDRDRRGGGSCIVYQRYVSFLSF